MTQGDHEAEVLNTDQTEAYDRPSFSADIALFTVSAVDSLDYRKLPEKHLSILLIRRGGYPYQNRWALPGGFVRPGETVEQAAIRELREESGVSDVSLSQLGVFSEPGRDPRGWNISCAFLALTESELIALAPSKDAADTQWFRIRYQLIHSVTEGSVQPQKGRSVYRLSLTCGDTVLSATIEVCVRLSNQNNQVAYRILDSEGLAFDHAQIIAAAVTSLRKELDVSLLAFNLLPDRFTLSELRMVYEVILDKKLTAANFRRKVSDLVTATDACSAGVGHRPAKLFRRKLSAFLVPREKSAE